MVYARGKRICVTCLTLYNDDLTAPPPATETFHPDDHDHSQPELMHYEASEQHTLMTTGELTMPMRVARALFAHGGTTMHQTVVPEHGLMVEVANIIANRTLTSQDPIRQGSAPTTATSADDTDIMMSTPDRAITPVRPVTPSQIPGSVFQGPIPETALNITPLPTYDQAVSRGQAPIYNMIHPDDIPLNRRTLGRIATYAVDMGLAYSDIFKLRADELHQNASSSTEHHAGMREIADNVERLENAWIRLLDEAQRRDRVLFQYNTTSATQLEAFDWIEEITRNPPDSVGSHARRFSEWLYLLEREYSNIVNPGEQKPSRRGINLAFERQEVHDQMTMQGDQWTGSADDWIPITEQDQQIYTDNNSRTVFFPSFYPADDEDDEDYENDTYPIVRSATGRVVQMPEAWGVPDPSESYTTGDMMDID